MRLLALLAVRNEIRYLDSVLTHLVEQGAEVFVIDNGSTDGTRELAGEWLHRGVVGIEDQPWTGVFELGTQLRIKERVATEERADWYVHVDADERRFAPPPYRTLADGLADVDARGYNAVDFDEFVFMPTAEEPSFEGRDFAAEMRWYYHYEPDSPDRLRINAWKRCDHVDIASTGGHHVRFPEQRVFPRPFVMRHYPVLSVDHAIEKYGQRPFDRDELARSWHSDRARFRPDRLRLPSRTTLREVAPGDVPDPSDPWDRHPFVDPDAGPKRRPPRTDADRPAREQAVAAYAERHRAHVPEIPPVSGSGPRPLWSVMFPVRDPRPDHLEDAIRGVLAQDPGLARMEIVVVDDASATDVKAIVSQVAGNRVGYVRNTEPKGLGGNWNAAVAHARGLLVHLHHQDDVVLPGFYDRLGRPLVDDPDLVAAYCRVSGVDDEGRLTWTQSPERVDAGIIPDLALKEAETHRMLIAGVALRRSTYETIGGYRDDLPYCTDWDLLKRASVLGPVWYEPLVLARWRRHAGQATARLQATAEDLVDRRRSIELTAALLPPRLRPQVSTRATTSSVVLALEALRELVEADALDAAVTQAREILVTLEGRQGGGGGPGLQALDARDHERDAQRRRIAELEAQLRGWVSAVRVAHEGLAGEP